MVETRVMTAIVRWIPAMLLAAGATLTIGIDRQQAVPLSRPLGDVVPLEMAGFSGRNVRLSDAELRAAGVSDYLMRTYERETTDDAGPWFSVYIGYYDRQTQGRTIHSPKNCLPGGGWEPLSSRLEQLTIRMSVVPVNRYVLQKGAAYTLVLYWYQGRGRVEANEYVVKWNLLRDAALHQRSEEALVRVVVPVTGGEDAAYELASRVAAELIPVLQRTLPPRS